MAGQARCRFLKADNSLNPKSEYRRSVGRSASGGKSETNLNVESQNPKHYDLEERTFLFAQSVRTFVVKLPRGIANQEDTRQLINASGSVGANYIEANEALSKKDFLMRIKISRKEAKESSYWLRLINTGNSAAVDNERHVLTQEARELTNIFGAILRKSQ